MNKNISKNKVSLIVLYLSIIYMIIGYISRFEPIIIVSGGIAIALAFIVLIDYHFNKTINIHLIIAYLVLFIGSALFYLIFGARPILERIGYNLLVILPSSMLIIAAILLCYKYKKYLRKGIMYAISGALIVTTIVYLFTMDMRMRPQVKRLYQGHDDYLASLNGTDMSDSPNVLFILMDDLGYADLSSYSYLPEDEVSIHTPNIDSIADLGVRFDNFYSSSPVCTPARFGALTGRYAARGYMDNVQFPSQNSLSPINPFRHFNSFEFTKGVEGIMEDEITVAEVMQSTGYNTGIFGKWHLGDYGEYLPNNQGFDYFFGSLHVNDVPTFDYYRNEEKIIEANDLEQSELTSMLTDEIVNFIDQSVDNQEKFFAYYATPWPHFPIHAGEDFSDTSTAGTYGDCIEEFDNSVGVILDTLREKGVFDDTLIIFTNDNGPGREGAVGGLRGRKNTTFDGGQKVPFMACYVNGFEHNPEIITSRSMLIDIFPTILDIVGIRNLPQDREIDGKSLKPIIYQEQPKDAIIHDALYFMKRGHVQGIQMPVEVNGVVYTFKYYESVRTENAAFIDQKYNHYLFNLDLDPAEAYNVAMHYEDVAQMMNEKLNEFRKELKENRRGIL